jgi:hypothetical protein
MERTTGMTASGRYSRALMRALPPLRTSPTNLSGMMAMGSPRPFFLLILRLNHPEVDAKIGKGKKIVRD